jgi:hypothetical protein
VQTLKIGPNRLGAKTHYRLGAKTNYRLDAKTNYRLGANLKISMSFSALKSPASQAHPGQAHPGQSLALRSRAIPYTSFQGMTVEVSPHPPGIPTPLFDK